MSLILLPEYVIGAECSIRLPGTTKKPRPLRRPRSLVVARIDPPANRLLSVERIDAAFIREFSINGFPRNELVQKKVSGFP